MAVQPWELPQIDQPERPRLRLIPGVESGQPQGRTGWAIFFAALLVATLALPAVGSQIFEPRQEVGWARRPSPALEIMKLDRLSGLPKPQRPMSSAPVVGFAFVRCTRLWTALPDGSHERKIVAMPGISSPAFAPNARSIAFLAERKHHQEFWVAAADGSKLRRLGSLRSGGYPLSARATGLTWSPDGKHVAFALVDGVHGVFEGGSAIWKLDIASGTFTKVGAGYPAPFWLEGNLAYSTLDEIGPHLSMRSGRQASLRWLSRGHDLAAALVPDGWGDNYRNGAAVLSRDATGKYLSISNLWSRNKRGPARPPHGYRFEQHARPVIAQDASTVAIGLVDRSGGSDVGLFDTRSHRWKILDYAWEPAASAAPVLTGPLGARLAEQTVRDLLSFWNKPGTTRRSLLMPEGDPSVLPFDGYLGFIPMAPIQSEDGWTVPGLVYGQQGAEWAYRVVAFDVAAHEGALRVRPRSDEPVQLLESVGDALRFTELALGRELAAPTVPASAKLRRHSFNAWSYDGLRSISFETKVPVEIDGERSLRTMGFGYGDDMDFSLGCGGAVDPETIYLNGTPAMADRSDGTHQVIWPGGSLDDRATHTVYGRGVPKSFVVETARRMEAVSP